MRSSELEKIRREASGTPAMTRVALDDLGNERTIRKKLQAEFEKSMRRGETVSQLTARIQRVAEMSHARALRIAQTEKTRAANGQRVADAIERYLTSDEYKKAVKNHRKRPPRPVFQWIDPRRARVPRPHHVAISGRIREAGEEFRLGLRWPGDPQAPPSEVINCHCYIREVRRK